MIKPLEGEHIFIGSLGWTGVYAAFIFAIVAAIAFFFSSFTKSESEKISWQRAGKVAFFIHASGVVTIIVSLYIIIHQHYFEYNYAWEHSNLALPMQYLLACFWEGQEGSFLLWMFWNTVLGTILIFSLKGNLSRVLSVFSVVQVFLASMLLGIYVFHYKVGSSPFVLLRNEMVNAPIFQRADYLSFIKDGNGLNPLLQNYWMVIHPPVLFLGFASTLVPFSFALSALMNKDFGGWTKSVLPWSLFSCAVLGTGIMMGGAWAYESLTFGGYWAWDPVENASLVPWLVMIGGMHTNLVYNKTGRSLRTTFILYMLSFMLVLYSTFLTRSGILGNTSVHAFTDLGMSGQLLIYMGALSIPAIVLLIIFWKKIPSIKKDENVWSREFWIFIGTIIFLISAVHITINTSLPVINKIFGSNFALPADNVDYFNRFQIWVAITLALLSTFALYLKFKDTEVRHFRNRIFILLAVAMPVTALISWIGAFIDARLILLLYAGVFGIIANGYYFVTVLKGKWKISGASVAHFGFALLMIGILISSAKQNLISFNNSAIDFTRNARKPEDSEGNMFLLKNKPQQMGEYTVTYVGDSVSPPNYYYKVLYEEFDSSKNILKDRFFLYPNAQINPKMGLIANPDTRHYWTKDLYTHVTSVPDKTKDEAQSDSLKFIMHTVAVGDTIYTNSAFIVVESIESLQHSDKTTLEQGDLLVAANLKVQTLDGQSYSMQPLYKIHNYQAFMFDDKLTELGLTTRFSKIIPEQSKFQIEVAETKPEQDFIVLKAIVFPYINLVWLGVVITISGFIISIVRIWQKRKITRQVEKLIP